MGLKRAAWLAALLAGELAAAAPIVSSPASSAAVAARPSGLARSDTAAAAVATGDDTWRRAAELARAGDYPAALAQYRALAAGGRESAALYWNWAQAAQARGSVGEALWALLRARMLDPGDSSITAALEPLRERARLDPAELAPEPRARLAEWVRRWHIDLWGLALLAFSVAAHARARARPGSRAWPATAAGAALGLTGVLVALVAGSARPLAVVVSPAPSLLDAAAEGANVLGSLREGEVLPILERRPPFVRVEDSSGARGWAHTEDVRPLDAAPEAAVESSSGER